jgi:hypothetical protein
MSQRWLGVVANSKNIIIVDAEVPEDLEEPIIVQMDDTWPLQEGSRPVAYKVLRQQLADYAREKKIDRGFVKASAVSGKGGGKLANLLAAEVRGVAICALTDGLPSAPECLLAASLSKTYGNRKVGEYVKDDGFFRKKVTGDKLRVGSREAAFLLLAARKQGGGE